MEQKKIPEEIYLKKKMAEFSTNLMKNSDLQIIVKLLKTKIKIKRESW